MSEHATRFGVLAIPEAFDRSATRDSDERSFLSWFPWMPPGGRVTAVEELEDGAALVTLEWSGE